MALNYLILIINILCHICMCLGESDYVYIQSSISNTQWYYYWVKGICDRRLAKVTFLSGLTNHDYTGVKYITKLKLSCPRSTLASNYKYLLYKYKFSHLDFYSNIYNILNKITLATVNDSVLLDQLCIE